MHTRLAAWPPAQRARRRKRKRQIRVPLLRAHNLIHVTPRLLESLIDHMQTEMAAMLASVTGFSAAGSGRAAVVGARSPWFNFRRTGVAFSTSGGGSSGSGDPDAGTGADAGAFRPRRRVPRSYRPLQPRPKPKAAKGPANKSDFLFFKNDPKARLNPDSKDLNEQFGGEAADFLRNARREAERGGPMDIEAQLRAIDYLTAPQGSTEDLIGERRGRMDAWTEEERESLAGFDDLIEEERIRGLKINEHDMEDIRKPKDLIRKPKFDPNQRAFGQWSETIIRVDRVQKVQRGGTMVRYRALVVGGNAHGCAGFGIGKAASPAEATQVAVRMCKRNVFFVDRYQGSGLSFDLAGKHNSCRVLLRSTEPSVGLKGHDLVCLILTYFGITDCSAKSHGNRNIYNVVRATFKAIMTHESLEEIALKRGKRLLNIERAKRLQI